MTQNSFSPLSLNELKMILEKGEGYRIEFKEKLNSGIDKEMIAFANASGGRILLGVTDSGIIKGLKITNNLKSQIQDMANNCEPAVIITMEEFKDILIINVFEGIDKPYKCSSGFYNRVGPNSQKMSRNDIIDFVKTEGKVRFDEIVCRKFEYEEHFDEKKLNKFLKIAGISKVLENELILKNLDVASVDELKKIVIYNAGALFFSKNLDDIYFHTTVTCALFKGKEKHTVLDRRNFNEDVVSSVDYSMNFLKKYISVRYEFNGKPQRIEVPEIPYEALREAVVNAIVHRDYFQKGANVMIEIYDDRIEIISPGGLVKGLSPEEFGEKSVLRNPNMANLFQRINYIEKMGTGIKRMQNMMIRAGLKPIKFDFSDLFVTATFYKNTVVNEEIVDPGAESRAESRAELEILAALLKSEMSMQEIANALNSNTVTGYLKRSVKNLLTDELVEYVLSEKPNSRLQKYRLTKKGFYRLKKKSMK